MKKRLFGMGDHALSNAIASLMKDGAIDKKVYNEVPPRVEYPHTEKGQRTACNCKNRVPPVCRVSGRRRRRGSSLPANKKINRNQAVLL